VKLESIVVVEHGRLPIDEAVVKDIMATISGGDVSALPPVHLWRLVSRLAARPGRIRRTCCLTPRAPCSRCSTSEGGAAFALWAAYASAPTSPPPAAQSRKPMGGVPTRASIGAVRAWRYTVGNGQAGGKS
jgi:hypothetical protein